ncbi:MAG: DUF5399 family protein [Simkaniaceae bacterium]
MTSRTIDNLGVESSVRYAADREDLDPKMIEESKGIPLHTQVDVTSPFFPSYTDLLFGTKSRHLPFPDFYPPKRYNDQRRRIFTHQILPSIGTHDMLMTQVERIRSVLDKDAGQKSGKGWEKEQDLNDEESEGHVLIQFLGLLQKLDRIIEQISSGRNQYQRG